MTGESGRGLREVIREGAREGAREKEGGWGRGGLCWWVGERVSEWSVGKEWSEWSD